MERCAEFTARRNVVYIAKLPAAGELFTTCAYTSPFGSIGRGKYASPPSTTPVASSQFSTKAAWRYSTAGPWMRTSVSRQ